MKFTLLYILTIYLVNLGFTVIPPMDLGFGLFSPMAIFVGAVFVVRDYAQRAVGHWVLLAMLIGCIISYYMADPFVAFASVASFIVSEIADWACFTWTKKPFHKRVLISSVVSAPIDSFIFLTIVDIMTPATFVMMIVCKLLTAGWIYYVGERNATSTTSA